MSSVISRAIECRVLDKLLRQRSWCGDDPKNLCFRVDSGTNARLERICDALDLSKQGFLLDPLLGSLDDVERRLAAEGISLVGDDGSSL